MGHLAIVNADTIQRINSQNPYISIGGTLGAYPYKTISDLFADALTVRDGDIIFTWMVNTQHKEGIGFDRYYIANGSVVFDANDTDFPIKIGVKEGYQYSNAISEEKALDLFSPRLLWNAIGKKSLGRGRSLSHQTTDEDQQLLALLAQANTGVVPNNILHSPIYNNKHIPITINNFGPIQNYIVRNYASLCTVLINNITWNKGDLFLYEKTLEAYLCKNIDKGSVSFCSLLGYPNHQIKWIGNYLPYGVAGKNIDMVCELEKENEQSIIVVIELKNDRISYNRYKRIINDQLNSYAQFIGDAFKSYRGKKFAIEQVVLTHSPRRSLAPGTLQYQNTKWIGYDIDPNSGTVTFTRLL